MRINKQRNFKEKLVPTILEEIRLGTKTTLVKKGKSLVLEYMLERKNTRGRTTGHPGDELQFFLWSNAKGKDI